VGVEGGAERSLGIVIAFAKLGNLCAYDAMLQALWETIKSDGCQKMREEGIDPDRYQPQDSGS
jgi:hypothetical protein